MMKLPGLSPRSAWLSPARLSPPALRRAAWLLLPPVIGLLGCPNEELAPIGPCTVSGVSDKITQNANEQVDVLFVVDDSDSMKQEQEILAAQLPRLVTILASGKITNEAGEVIREFPPVKSLHLGVTTTDLGVNGLRRSETDKSCIAGTVNVSTADAPVYITRVKGAKGDDGKLINTPTAGCTDTVFKKPYLEFRSGVDDPVKLGTDFGCITQLGIKGCGFEQPLEAALKALSPSSDKTFSRDTGGHGDRANAGFLRKNSVVAVIIVTDEEDCSIPDASRSLFSTKDYKTLNVACFRADADRLLPPRRYINGLKALRPDNPDQIIFAAIAGLPPEAEELAAAAKFNDILKLPAMQYGDSMLTGGYFESNTSCIVPGVGEAYPPRRIVEVAKGFGKNGVVRSICNTDYSGALTAIIDKIADQLQGACLDRTLVTDRETGLAPCGLIEILSAEKKSSTDCKAAQGRKFMEMREIDGEPRVVCRLNQLAVDISKPGCDAKVPAGETTPEDCLKPNPNSPNDRVNPKVTDALVGWYYDEFSEELRKHPRCNQQRIAFSKGAEQPPGSEILFECLQPVFSIFKMPKGVEAVNKPCCISGSKEAACPDSDNFTCAKSASTEEYTLYCDDARSTCQISCKQDANCPDGWVCDRAGDSGRCTNPTCPPG